MRDIHYPILSRLCIYIYLVRGVSAFLDKQKAGINIRDFRSGVDDESVSVGILKFYFGKKAMIFRLLR